MIIAPPWGLAASTVLNTSAHRSRSTSTTRTILPSSTPAASEISALGTELPEEPVAPEPVSLENEPSAAFAAAVLSSAPGSTPHTSEELFKQVGANAIPDAFEGRLKDLTA